MLVWPSFFSSTLLIRSLTLLSPYLLNSYLFAILVNLFLNPLTLVHLLHLSIYSLVHLLLLSLIEPLTNKQAAALIKAAGSTTTQKCSPRTKIEKTKGVLTIPSVFILR